ncbi:hypothetical protein BG003_004418 [Podila horticola]|nr:hypothetical protein BG003_004418 [Podila horticola]
MSWRIEDVNTGVIEFDAVNALPHKRQKVSASESRHSSLAIVRRMNGSRSTNVSSDQQCALIQLSEHVAPAPRRSKRLHPVQPTPNLRLSRELSPPAPSSSPNSLIPATEKKLSVQTLPVELLDHVLRYLDQNGLKHARFVCKEWFDVSSQLFDFELSWTHTSTSTTSTHTNTNVNVNTHTFEDFLLRLCLANGLKWERFSDWGSLLTTILYAKPQSTTTLKVLAARDLPSNPLRVPLRRLEINGSGSDPLTTFPAMDAFKDLTSLSLMNCDTKYVALQLVFKSCPQLKRLRVVDGRGFLPWSHTSTAVPRPSAVTSVSPQLKTLSIARPSFFIPQLLELLESQRSLQVLRLNDFGTRTGTEDATQGAVFQWLQSEILEYLRSSTVRDLHVSFPTLVNYFADMARKGTGETFEEGLAMACPNVPVWRVFADTSGRFPMLLNLCNHRNVVTTLDLKCQSGKTLWKRRSSDLDFFLCQARFLLHLRLPKMHGRPASMNLFRDMDISMAWIGNYLTPSSSSSSSQALEAHNTSIWACRSLKTLSIGFSADERDDLPPWQYHDTFGYARVIFGYLSRVCPNLQELIMDIDINNLFMDTGLCLLTRMEQLRRLEITLGWCSWPVAQRIEIGWIKAANVAVDAGVGDEWQIRHANRLKQSWEIIHETELEIVCWRERRMQQWSRADQTRRHSSEVKASLQVDDRWEQLGLFMDVKRVSFGLQRQGQAGHSCWPRMESFRIIDKHGDSTQAEEVIKRLRPEINSQDFKVKAHWGWEEF